MAQTTVDIYDLIRQVQAAISGRNAVVDSGRRRFNGVIKIYYQEGVPGVINKEERIK
jgi:hypothetical protein